MEKFTSDGAQGNIAGKRHPKGLYILAGAEMWERFSFYGMRALLVLYLTDAARGGPGFERGEALLLYGTYTGLVYLSPLLGGYLADRYLGQRKAILIGGLLMAFGHSVMAFPQALHWALGLLVVGNGFFKPNISAMVGQQYEPDDPRRDSAYTVFYMGINIGAFIAPLICGTLGESDRFGWHWGFAAAGVGMVLGLTNFVFGGHLLLGGYPRGRDDARLTRRDWLDVVWITGLCALALHLGAAHWDAISLVWTPTLLERLPATTAAHPVLGSFGWAGTAGSTPQLTPWIWAYRGILMALAVGVISLLARASGRRAESRRDRAGQGPDHESLTPREMLQIAVIIVVSTFTVLFWAGYEQAGGTLTLFAQENTRLEWGPIQLRATWFQAINPLFVVLIAPLFSRLWTWLNGRPYRVPAIARMGIGLIILGFGFGLMVLAEDISRLPEGAIRRVSPLWLVAFYMAATAGELCLSPVGLSVVNKLAPARMGSLAFGIFFAASALGNFAAGSAERVLGHFDYPLYELLMAGCVSGGLVWLSITPMLRRLSGRRD